MLNEVKAALDRSSATLLQDCFGVATLFAFLIAGLTLTGLA